MTTRMHGYSVLGMEIISHEEACQEYGMDILNHLIDLDKKCTQETLTRDGNKEVEEEEKEEDKLTMLNYYSLRKLIFDFIMCCHTKLRLSTPTLILAFKILDKHIHISKNYIQMLNDRLEFQMLGMVSLWIAAKFIDTKLKHPDLYTLLQLISPASSELNKDSILQKCQELKKMELNILQNLQWCVSNIPTHDSFIDILLRNMSTNRADNDEDDDDDDDINQIKYGAQMLCELSCFYPHLNNNHSISEISYASVVIIKHCMYTKTNTGERLSPLEEDIVKVFQRCNRIRDKHQDGFYSLPFSFRLKYFPKSSENNPLFLSRLLHYIDTLSTTKSTTLTTTTIQSKIPPTPNTPSLVSQHKSGKRNILQDDDDDDDDGDQYPTMKKKLQKQLFIESNI